MADDGTSDGSLSCGLHVNFTADLALSLQQLVYQGQFSFLLTPLVHPRRRRDCAGVSARRTEPLTRSDLILESRAWGNCVVGELSRWVDCDSPVEASRKASEAALLEELSWATHLSMLAVVAPTPRPECFNLANVLNRSMAGGAQHPAVWVTMPLCTKQSLKGEQPEAEPWRVWNRLRMLCDSAQSLSVLLELTESLPSRAEVDKWVGEPVKALKIPMSVFLCNSKGYPVLSAAHQQVVVALHQHGAQLVLSGRPSHAEGATPYYLYLQHLIQRLPPLSTKDEFEQPFYDYLQSPLQPLNDHLESQMYETFEKDPVKYAKYEEAIALALSETPADKVSVVMVVGAGRGPLVRASLRAADTAGRRIRMYAVEKNPNAVITLRNMKRMLGWGDIVEVVHTDMRVWDAPEKADILVSELLGSWGDNELSPECLDGAEKFLKRDGGISIPYEYTSLVQPVSTPKLWNDVKAFGEVKHFDTMYVVKLHNYCALGPNREVFTFAHPSWHKATVGGSERFSAQPVASERAIDNRRYCEVEFTSTQTALMHGFAGYFEARLYKDVMISINPDTFSTGMFSWFPIYIPLRQPMPVQAGEKIKAVFWRHCNPSKVWYEWAVVSPHAGPIHNVNGASSPIFLSTE